jgi:hypothetical protein
MYHSCLVKSMLHVIPFLESSSNAVLSLLNIKTTDDISGVARKLASGGGGAFFLMNKKINLIKNIKR